MVRKLRGVSVRSKRNKLGRLRIDDREYEHTLAKLERASEAADTADAPATATGRARRRRIRRGRAWVYDPGLKAYTLRLVTGPKGGDGKVAVLDLSGRAPAAERVYPSRVHWITYDEPPCIVPDDVIQRAWTRARIMARRKK